MRTCSTLCGLALIGVTLFATTHATGRILAEPETDSDADALPVMGPCCLPDGSCLMMYCPDCNEQGGVWHGPGLDCDSVNCKPCPADFDGSGCVDFFDYLDFVDCYSSGNCPPGHDADMNDDGQVDDTDMDLFLDALEAGSCS